MASKGERGQLDALSYEAKEAQYIRAYLPAGVEVLELGASLGIGSSVIPGRRPARLVSYEAVGPLADVARQVVAHNHPAAPWGLIHCAVAAESAKAPVRVPAVSLAGAIARYRMPVTAWLVMDIEGMEWELARHQAAALRHFDGIIVECH